MAKPWGITEEIPQVVSEIATRIQAPFYSVDVAMTTRGEHQLVELGDGQVSDKKDWPLEAFIKVLRAIAAANIETAA
ncbi:MAG: ATP-grasp domain-containing protein [Cyanobacteria bacterium J06598_3]